MILFGIPKNMMDQEQKGGCGGHSDNAECLILLIAKSWTFETATIAKQKYESNAKVKRTDDVMFNYMGLKDCRYCFSAKYNNDNTKNGK